ncbi:MAG: hypothetical protein U9532_03570 ['Conium maculatum' witches'-broom phytoplasma]|nr:hypothetical protein ['Conium maculatum' witches'-broom phytoplasma]
MKNHKKNQKQSQKKETKKIPKKITSFYNNGTIRSEIEFKDGKMVKDTCYNETRDKKKWVHEYDENGKKTKSTYYNHDGTEQLPPERKKIIKVIFKKGFILIKKNPFSKI